MTGIGSGSRGGTGRRGLGEQAVPGRQVRGFRGVDIFIGPGWSGPRCVRW